MDPEPNVPSSIVMSPYAEVTPDGIDDSKVLPEALRVLRLLHNFNYTLSWEDGSHFRPLIPANKDGTPAEERCLSTVKVPASVDFLTVCYGYHTRACLSAFPLLFN